MYFMCGRVNLSAKKYHIMLQALSSMKTQRLHLKVELKDRIIGTWKARNMEGLPPVK